MEISKQEIIEAHERIINYVHHTPVLTSDTINRKTEAEIFFKCENFQKVGAFKFRGASNAVISLTSEEKESGVATHSSGNHAQALALAAANRNIPAYIVMPENSPQVKIDAVRDYGAHITFCKPTLQAREETLEAVIKETGAIFIHPYNNYRIIAGQATAAKELIEKTGDLDYILVPVGGGGLLSGTALANFYFNPKGRVLAGEPENADDAERSFKAGKIIPSVDPNTIADGLKTSLGDKTFPIIQQYVENILTVSEDEILEAMRFIWERMKMIIEPSSAVPVAVLFKNKTLFVGKKMGIIISGGNVDLTQKFW